MTLVVGFLLSALSWRLLLFSSLPAGVIGFAFPPATTTTTTAAAAAGTCSASSSCWLPRRRRQKRGTAFAVGPLYMFDFFNPKPTTGGSGGTATTAATTTEASKEEEEEETATAATATSGGEAIAAEQEERVASEVVPEDTPADVAAVADVATEEKAAEEEATGEEEKDAAAVVGVSEQEAVEEEESSEEEETPVIEASDDNEEQDKEEAAAATEAEGQPKKVVARERHTVFVGNLPFDVTDDEVRDLFAEHGRVALVTMPRDRATGRPRGFAFVDMGSPEQRDAAIQALHETPFGGRTLRVVESVPKDQQEKQRRAPPPSAAADAVEDGYEKIYVGNLPFSATREDVMSYYEPYGEVREAYLPYNQQTGQIRGFAFVTMKEEDAAAAIEATNGQDFGGRPLTVNYPLPPGEKAPPRRGAGRGGGGGPRGGGPPTIKLYCGSLSFYTTRETLRELFEEFGDVHDCYLPEDAERGGSRGFGFVTMDRDAALAAVDELDGIELDGRIIRVNEARPKFTRRQQQRGEEEEEQQFDDDDEIEIEGGGGDGGGGYGNPNDD